MLKFAIVLLMLFTCCAPVQAQPMPQDDGLPPLLYIAASKLKLNNKALPELEVAVLNLYAEEGVSVEGFVLEAYLFHDDKGTKQLSKKDGTGENWAFVEFPAKLDYGESGVFSSPLYGFYDANVVLYRVSMVVYSNSTVAICNSEVFDCYADLVCLGSVDYCELDMDKVRWSE